MSPDNFSFIKEYNLKQITPMIHFQYDENGACIRPSELKPKLDRFLLLKPVKSTKGNKIPDIWKMKGQGEALNYKVFIYPESSASVIKSDTVNRDIKLHEVSKNKSLTVDQKRTEKSKINQEYREKGIDGLFFGNMVNNYDPNYDVTVKKTYKETVFYNQPIRLKIVCHLPELLEHIDEYIEEFFVTTNFGTRQNKGFGSFLIDGGHAQADVDSILNKGGYCYIKASFPTQVHITKEEGFKIASAVYSAMKGGLNLPARVNNAPGLYIKGYLQRRYLDDLGLNNVGSDKAFVKSEILPVKEADRDKLRPVSEKPDDEPERGRSYEDYIYVRSLLGVADHVEYKDPKGNCLRTGKVNISCNEVERFPSIITVKITGTAVYFIINEPNKKIFGKKFVFSSDKNTNSIETPTSFDKKKFKTDFITYFYEVRDRFDNNNYYRRCSTVELE